MNKIKILLIATFSFFAIQVYAQYSPCGGGDDNSPYVPPKEPDGPHGGGGGNIYNPVDPNEIIGTKGYDALGDTLQWVAATASLPYTIYFENDPEFATAAAQKVEILHAYYSIMN